MKKMLSILEIFILIFLVACSGTNKAVEISNPVIRFSSDREGNNGSYFMALDGTNVKPLLFQGLPKNVKPNPPVWSAELKRWVFSVEMNNGSDADIYTANWDGSDLKNITNTPERYENTPVVSPDGRFIAYVAMTGSLDIFIAKSDGSEERNISSNLFGNQVDPVWTSDSRNIVFSSNHEGTPLVYKMDTQGKNVTNLSQGKGLDDAFSLSPDNRYLVFSSDRDGNLDLFVLDMKDKSITNLTKSEIRENNPVWSPDGKYIAFRKIEEKDLDIYIMEFASRTITKLTNTPEIDEQGISWLSDSQHILFNAESSDNKMEIYKVDLSGTVQDITNNAANDYGAVEVIQNK